jgi:hypothetical protein
MKLIATKTFKSSLIMEGSWGEQSLGEHESVMELYLTEDKTRGFIEWDVPDLQELTEIGLWLQTHGGKMMLTDYDGVFSLPYEAIKMLEETGVYVGAEFK